MELGQRLRLVSLIHEPSSMLRTFGASWQCGSVAVWRGGRCSIEILWEGGGGAARMRTMPGMRAWAWSFLRVSSLTLGLERYTIPAISLFLAHAWLDTLRAVGYVENYQISMMLSRRRYNCMQGCKVSRVLVSTRI